MSQIRAAQAPTPDAELERFCGGKRAGRNYFWELNSRHAPIVGKGFALRASGVKTVDNE